MKLTNYQKHILLSLDTVMRWANNELPDDDPVGYIYPYNRMPVAGQFDPKQFKEGYFDRFVQQFIHEMKQVLPKEVAKVYEDVLNKIPYEDIKTGVDANSKPMTGQKLADH